LVAVVVVVVQSILLLHRLLPMLLDHVREEVVHLAVVVELKVVVLA
jgi:hypothetical protein